MNFVTESNPLMKVLFSRVKDIENLQTELFKAANSELESLKAEWATLSADVSDLEQKLAIVEAS